MALADNYIAVANITAKLLDMSPGWADDVDRIYDAFIDSPAALKTVLVGLRSSIGMDNPLAHELEALVERL